MPKIPYKALLFAALAGFFYLHGLPSRAAFVSTLLRDRRARSAEDSARALVEEKVRRDICRFEDACEYQPVSWEDFAASGDGSSLVHVFNTDGNRRKFLFRIRSGQVSEIIDLL
jgi:hypothetical protein